MYFSHVQFMAHANREGQGHIRRGVRWELLGNTDPQYHYANNPVYNTLSTDDLTEDEAATYLTAKLEAIANRDSNSRVGMGTGKWHRPWDIVPELKEWSAPVGDYGVGVEVEMGFNTIEAAQQVAHHVKDWEYITLDYEGGDIPIEATFPPVPYSEFSSSYAMQYLAYLKENEALVYDHYADESVGTHINVSVGGQRIPSHRVDTMFEVLSDEFYNYELRLKYFGRHPYDFCFAQGSNWTDGTCRWVEFKLFNSQLEPARLQQYVDEAVSLVKLMMSDEDINYRTVHIALEEGYCKSLTSTANVSNDAEPIALAIAA